MLVLRAVPIRLSKYSYLTQSGIPVLVGAVTVGPTPVVLSLYLGVLGADVVWLRKLPRAGFINAGREVLGFLAAFGPYAAVHHFSGTPTLSLNFLPSATILVVMYFFSTRALFYFTLLVRDKLEYAEKILILRWEIISYLLTLIAAVVVVATILGPRDIAALRQPAMPEALNVLMVQALIAGPAAFLLAATTPLLSAWYGRRGWDPCGCTRPPTAPASRACWPTRSSWSRSSASRCSEPWSRWVSSCSRPRFWRSCCAGRRRSALCISPGEKA